jgi:hypothetical protein
MRALAPTAGACPLRLRELRHVINTFGADRMSALPFAADYPFLNILWSMLVFVGFFFWIWLAVTVFMDVFRRRDMGGFMKALWIIAVILVPLFGVLIYLLAYHNSMAERNVKQVEAAQAAFDQQVRQAAGTAGPASEIATAQSLLAAGTISQEEFHRKKTKALAG